MNLSKNKEVLAYGLELKDLPASTFQVLASKVCVTLPVNLKI